MEPQNHFWHMGLLIVEMGGWSWFNFEFTSVWFLRKEGKIMGKGWQLGISEDLCRNFIKCLMGNWSARSCRQIGRVNYCSGGWVAIQLNLICLISENGKEEQWEKFIKGAGQKICLGVNCGSMKTLDGKSIWIVRQNWNDFEEELTGYWEAEEQDGQYGYPNSPWNFLQSENYTTSLLIFDLVHVWLRFEHVFDAEITVRRFKDSNSFIVSAPWEKLGFFWMLHPVTTSGSNWFNTWSRVGMLANCMTLVQFVMLNCSEVCLGHVYLRLDGVLIRKERVLEFLFSIREVKFNLHLKMVKHWC